MSQEQLFYGQVTKQLHMEQDNGRENQLYR